MYAVDSRMSQRSPTTANKQRIWKYPEVFGGKQLNMLNCFLNLLSYSFTSFHPISALCGLQLLVGGVSLLFGSSLCRIFCFCQRRHHFVPLSVYERDTGATFARATKQCRFLLAVDLASVAVKWPCITNVCNLNVEFCPVLCQRLLLSLQEPFSYGYQVKMVEVRVQTRNTPPACKASSSAACLRAMASAFAF